MYFYYLTNSFVFSTNLTRFSVFLQCLDISCTLRAEVYIIIVHFSLMLTLKFVSLGLLALTSLSCSSDDTRALKLNMAGIHWTQGVWRSVPLSSKWSQMGCDRFDGWPAISGVSASRGRIILGFWWDSVLRHHFAHFGVTGVATKIKGS